MAKARVVRKKSKHNIKMIAKAGKDRDAITPTQPRKAPGRTIRQPGGMRASLNRGAKSRVKG